jgi:5-methylcytosine-specific restriction enzyme subunit McrC
MQKLMNKRLLELNEYQSKESVELSQEQLKQLTRLAPGISISPSSERIGLYKLTPDSRIGIVNLPDLQILIRPKILMSRAMFLIAYSLNKAIWRTSGFNFDTEDSLLESLIPGFILQIRNALIHGVLHGYRTEEDSLLTVRGRMRIEDQIRRRHGMVIPVEVRFDEFTNDIDENRLIKAALFSLRKLVLRSDDSRRQLHEFDHLLGRVSLTEYHPTNLPQVTYSRLNEHYRSAVELSKLILKSTSLELRHGASYSSAFTIDMNVVFEDFVVTALRENLGLSQRVFPQNFRMHLDHGEKISIKPDLSWWERGRCVFVGDVKYKRTTSAKGENPDIYQALSYAVAANLRNTMLVYAKGEAEESSYYVGDPSHRIDIHALDLASSTQGLLDQIAAIARRIREHRERAITETFAA